MLSGTLILWEPSIKYSEWAVDGEVAGSTHLTAMFTVIQSDCNINYRCILTGHAVLNSLTPIDLFLPLLRQDLLRL